MQKNVQFVFYFAVYSFLIYIHILHCSSILECPSVMKDLVERKMEMVENVPLTVWVGTWNVNGGKNFSDIAFRNQTNLADWLFPQHFPGICIYGCF